MAARLVCQILVTASHLLYESSKPSNDDSRATSTQSWLVLEEDQFEQFYRTILQLAIQS